MFPFVQPVNMWRNGGIAPFILPSAPDGVNGSFHPNSSNRGFHWIGVLVGSNAGLSVHFEQGIAPQGAWVEKDVKSESRRYFLVFFFVSW